MPPLPFKLEMGTRNKLLNEEAQAQKPAFNHDPTRTSGRQSSEWQSSSRGVGIPEFQLTSKAALHLGVLSVLTLADPNHTQPHDKSIQRSRGGQLLIAPPPQATSHPPPLETWQLVPGILHSAPFPCRWICRRQSVRCRTDLA